MLKGLFLWVVPCQVGFRAGPCNPSSLLFHRHPHGLCHPPPPKHSLEPGTGTSAHTGLPSLPPASMRFPHSGPELEPLHLLVLPRVTSIDTRPDCKAGFETSPVGLQCYFPFICIKEFFSKREMAPPEDTLSCVKSLRPEVVAFGRSTFQMNSVSEKRKTPNHYFLLGLTRLEDCGTNHHPFHFSPSLVDLLF